VGSPKPGHTDPLSEDETLERIRRTLEGGIEAPGLGRGAEPGAGLRDDAAVLEVPGGGSLIVSVDSVVEGVHVDLTLCTASDVGWKALMGALSDLAAMGARPLGALVALCVPESDGSGATTVGVMEGVAEASRAAGCPVVGGDISAGAVLMASVTVMGTTGADGGAPVWRGGALAGDVVLVTGPCGGSAAGLRILRSSVEVVGGEPESSYGAAYRRPVARVEEGVAARLAGAHAMIDVSDGLALDLRRLADASGVGFVLDTVPVAEGATEDEALGGGEDYELVLTMDESSVEGFERRCADAGLRRPCRIGVVSADPAVRMLRDRELPRLGWQHRMG
jgi:thiamine-monophosphate kinase